MFHVFSLSEGKGENDNEIKLDINGTKEGEAEKSLSVVLSEKYQESQWYTEWVPSLLSLSCLVHSMLLIMGSAIWNYQTQA